MAVPFDPRDTVRLGAMSGFQVLAVVLCILMNMMDGFDILAAGFTAPAIARHFALGSEAVGLFLGASPAGMILGALFLAPLADRWGRRATVLVCLATIAAGMGATASAASLAPLLIGRLITGIGVGALMAAVNTVVAEFSNEQRREMAVCLQAAGFPAGGVVGGLAFYFLGGMDWRLVYAIGALISLLFVPAVLVALPDSLDFLIERRPPNALVRVNALLRRMNRPPVAALPVPKASIVGVAAALRSPGAPGICAGFFLMMLTFYFLSSWIPTILTGAGRSIHIGVSASILMSLGGVVGDILFALGTTRWKARALGAVFCLLTFACALLVAMTLHLDAVLLVAALGLGMFLYGAMASHYAVVPALFPATARASGTGLALGIGRIGATLGPVLGGVLFAHGGDPVVTVGVMALPLVICAALLKGMGKRAEAGMRGR
ncbi:MFS transporter [Sphingomonas sp.]|uniref:MFS transporter n=1 Tax=Sphingomonas sp. TaxID=28214 RepID=UPI0025EEA486|nr:MFS transporter [Sphingomonas sp.]